MPTLIVTTLDGTEHRVEGVTGRPVMEIIRDNGFTDMLALCGGARSCATCHVYVGPDQLALLPDMSEDENELLDSSSHRKINSRLSCQIVFNGALDGLHVTIAPED
ncbi:2Fe-2S iron-sulfur cluster-binding protein [Nitrospirillum iridis]|uniref:2Fe-2S ferredoxin n=1 Tax=Nitrospirillum iridis TaxID=765888 RepID=A0A7X0B2N8_9PROT|nr:2Fe-2S iron-sulfur cluster-binding protein [Nitrospirillum iridis]MBB6253296.1 2Fe-2S ferredoxin [Nitrospirillum iridis]